MVEIEPCLAAPPDVLVLVENVYAKRGDGLITGGITAAENAAQRAHEVPQIFLFVSEVTF